MQGWRKLPFNQAQMDELALATEEDQVGHFMFMLLSKACKWKSLWWARKMTRTLGWLEQRLLWGIRDGNEQARSQFMKRFSNHEKEFGPFVRNLSFSMPFRPVFMELAISGWSVFLFTGTKWGVRKMEMERLRPDNHLLEVMKSVVLD